MRISKRADVRVKSGFRVFATSLAPSLPFAASMSLLTSLSRGRAEPRYAQPGQRLQYVSVHVHRPIPSLVAQLLRALALEFGPGGFLIQVETRGAQSQTLKRIVLRCVHLNKARKQTLSSCRRVWAAVVMWPGPQGWEQGPDGTDHRTLPSLSKGW